jgi:hypothetical protein
MPHINVHKANDIPGSREGIVWLEASGVGGRQVADALCIVPELCDASLEQPGTVNPDNRRDCYILTPLKIPAMGV